MKKLTLLAVILLALVCVSPSASAWETLGSSQNACWLWPTNGSKYLTRGFCDGSGSFVNANGVEQSENVHWGLDISTTGQVLATKDGIVVQVYSSCRNVNGANEKVPDCAHAGICDPKYINYTYGYCNNGYGNGVVIDHRDGTYSYYAHMKANTITVEVGMTVKQGQPLGEIGSSGNSTGTHLHFGIGNNKSGIDTGGNNAYNCNPSNPELGISIAGGTHGNHHWNTDSQGRPYDPNGVYYITDHSGNTPVTPVSPVTFSNFTIIEQSGSTARASVKWSNPSGLRITQVGMMYSKNHIQNEQLTSNLINSCLPPSFRFALVTESINANYQNSAEATFTESLEALEPGTTYYLRPFVVDSSGTVHIYKGEFFFKTHSGSTVELHTISTEKITDNSATVSAMWSNEEGIYLKNAGVLYSEFSTLNTILTATQLIAGTNCNRVIEEVGGSFHTAKTANFSETISSLKSGTTYFARLFIIDSANTVHFQQGEITFQTTGAPAKEAHVGFSNVSVKNISDNIGTIFATWINEDGLYLTYAGVVYSESSTLNTAPTAAQLIGGTNCNRVIEEVGGSFHTAKTANFSETISSLKSGTTYFARLFIIDSANKVHFQQDEKVFQTTGNPIVAPNKVEVWQTNNVVSVSFSAVENTSGYDVYLVQAPWGWEDIRYHISTTGTQANFENIAAGDYAAFVIPKNSDPYGPQSPWQSIHVASLSEIPQNVRAEQQGNKMKISFDPVEKALGYSVYMLAPPYYWADLKYSTYTTDSFVEFTDIDSGMYSVLVMAKFTDWDSPSSAWMYVTYEAPEIVAPEMANAWQINNVVTVSFNPVEYVSGYDVYLLQDPWGWNDIKYHQFTTDTIVSFEDVAAGYYGIFIVPKNKNPYGPQSECRYFHVASVSDIPQNVRTEQVYNRMQVSFDPVEKAIGYNVSLVHLSDEGYNVKYSAYTTEPNAVFKDLIPGQYDVYVTAKFAEQESPQSKWIPVFYAPPVYEFCLTLPNMLSVIEQEAFAGVQAEMIVIPAGVTRIESKAFAACPNLRAVVFEGNPVEIAEDFLNDCINVTIRCKKGTRAEHWASSCGYRIEYQ